MNPTDEVSISSMFAEAKTLCDMKKKTSEKYVNEKIRDYALSVLDNHKRIRRELTETLAKNRYVLGKNVKLRAEIAFGYFKNKIFLGDDKINVRCHLANANDITILSSYCSNATICTPSDNIVIEDIWWHTSNTSDKDYSICSAWRLDNNPIIDDENGKSRAITKEDIESGSFTEKEWKQIHARATWTEAYTKKLVEYFKKFIEGCVAMLRSSVNSDLAAKQANQSVLNNGTHTTTVNITWTI